MLVQSMEELENKHGKTQYFVSFVIKTRTRSYQEDLDLVMLLYIVNFFYAYNVYQTAALW